MTLTNVIPGAKSSEIELHLLFLIMDRFFVAPPSFPSTKFLLAVLARVFGSLAYPVFRDHVLLEVVGTT